MKYLFYSFFLLLSISLFSQSPATSFSETFLSADIVVEGEIAQNIPFQSEKNGYIYTKNVLQVKKLISGTLPAEEISIITIGGDLNNKSSSWSHALTFHKGTKGVFSLKRMKLLVEDQNNVQNYELVNGRDGFFEFVSFPNGIGFQVINPTTTWNSPSSFYSDIEKHIGHPIIEISKWQHRLEKLFFANEMNRLKGICYSIGNLSINAFNQTLSFNLLVTGVYGKSLLSEAGIAFSYNPDYFGGTLVANSLLTVSIDQSLNTSYEVESTDISSSKASISFSKKSSNNNFLEITEIAKSLASITISVANPSLEPDFIVDEDLSKPMNVWVDNNFNNPKEYDEFCFEGTVGEGGACPKIESISISSAGAGLDNYIASGVNYILEITGENFIDPPNGQVKPDNRRVQFSAIEGGEVSALITDYILWSNELIRLRVPSIGHDGDDDDLENISLTNFVGTGKVRVKTEDFEVCFSNTEDFYIPFANKNILRDNNISWSTRAFNDPDSNEGGMPIFLDPSFTAISGAKDAFIRALETWRCKTGINYHIVENEIPGSSVVYLDDFSAFPNVNNLARGVTTTDQLSQACTSENIATLNAFAMYFRSQIDGDAITWYTGESTSNTSVNGDEIVDLETIALHELGHAMLLTHTKNENNVMFFETETYQRKLTEDDILGGKQIASQSSVPECTMFPKMILVNETNCQISTNVTNEKLNPNNLFIAPNPASSIIYFATNEEVDREHEIVVYGVSGKLIKHEKFSKQLNVSELKEGIYFVQIINKQGTVTHVQKFIKIY